MNGWANKYLSNISFLFFSFFFSSIKRFFLHYFPRCKFTGGNSFEEIVIVSRKLIPIPFPSPLKSFGFNVFVDILIGEITLRPVTLSYNFNDNFNWRKSRRINFHASRNISRVGSSPPRIQSSREQGSRNVDPISRRRSSRRFNLHHQLCGRGPRRVPLSIVRISNSSCVSHISFSLIERKGSIDIRFVQFIPNERGNERMEYEREKNSWTEMLVADRSNKGRLISRHPSSFRVSRRSPPPSFFLHRQ